MDRRWRRWSRRPDKAPTGPRRSPTRTQRWLGMAASGWCSRPSSATTASWSPSRRCYRTRDSRWARLWWRGGARTNFPISVLQNRELQIMRRLEHCNIVKLKYFFYSSGEKVSTAGPQPVAHPPFRYSFITHLLVNASTTTFERQMFIFRFLFSSNLFLPLLFKIFHFFFQFFLFTLFTTCNWP